MLRHGGEYTAHLQAEAEADLRAMDSRFPAIEDLPVTPTLYTVMTDTTIASMTVVIVGLPPIKQA